MDCNLKIHAHFHYSTATERLIFMHVILYVTTSVPSEESGLEPWLAHVLRDRMYIARKVNHAWGEHFLSYGVDRAQILLQVLCLIGG